MLLERAAGDGRELETEGRRVPETSLAVTSLGHATVLMEMDGVRILTDPELRARVVHLRRLLPDSGPAVGGLDGKIVSHLHFDHFDSGTLRDSTGG